MRKMSLVIAGLAMAFGTATTNARTLDPDRPEDAIEIAKRFQCGAADGEPAVYYWSGRVYSRVQGEPDRHLFNGEGMNIRQCVSTVDPARGPGYRLVSREIMLFTDPVSGEVVREWSNPWTGETVPVMHIANDPVNWPFAHARSADGTPYRLRTIRQGRWLMLPLEVPLFYTNPLAGDYQDYVGNKYHAMEIFDFAADAHEALDTDIRSVHPTVSWVRLSDWMPWMKMRGRQGQIVFNAMGAKLKSFDELPDVIKEEIRSNYPEYAEAPPLDDSRPNATTWTVFKKQIDEERERNPQPQQRRPGH